LSWLAKHWCYHYSQQFVVAAETRHVRWKKSELADPYTQVFNESREYFFLDEATENERFRCF
jgi:hypothetical protein